MRRNRNITLYYILTCTNSFWFISSNWVYFWTKYMTFGTLGWVDALAFAFSLLLEIPSGAIADIIGKKKTIVVGMFFGALGTFLMASATNFTSLFWGGMSVQVAYAFYSGAAEALAFDSLKEKGEEHLWQKVNINSNIIDTITSSLTNFIGGFMYVYWFRLPQYMWFAGYFLSFLFSLFLIEPKIDSEKFSIKNYLNQIYNGSKLLSSKNLRRYTFFILAIPGIYFMYSWGFIRPAIATSLGFFAKEQSIIFSAMTLISIVVIKFLPTIKKKISDTQGLFFLSFLMFLAFFIVSFNVGYFGIVALLMFAVAGKLANPWISIVINDNSPSKYRATTLSAVAFLTKLPYVVVAIVAGKMIENNQIGLFNMGVSSILGISIVTTAIIINKNKLKFK